jgi:hypothetical protein
MFGKSQITEAAWYISNRGGSLSQQTTLVAHH